MGVDQDKNLPEPFARLFHKELQAMKAATSNTDGHG